MTLLNNKIIKSKKASYKGVLDLSIIDKVRVGESNLNKENDCRFRDEVIKEAIESAEIKKNEILEEAKMNAQNIEKQAYEKGYSQGQKMDMRMDIKSHMMNIPKKLKMKQIL